MELHQIRQVLQSIRSAGTSAYGFVFRYFIFSVMIVFSIGLIFDYTVRAQVPTTWSNSAAIATVEGKVAVLEMRISSFSDIQIQMQLIRDRLTVLETKETAAGAKIDEIYTAKNWLIFGVFSILLNEAMKRLKFKSKDSDEPGSGERQTLESRKG